MNTGPIFLLLFIATIALPGCAAAPHQQRRPAYFDKEVILEAVNNLRKKGCKCGGVQLPAVPPLQWSDRLATAAQLHSNDMSRRKNLSHTGSGKSNPGSRAVAAGYKWSFVAENIAMGQQTVDEVMSSWVNSPGHCKNIMNKNASEIGAARSGAYWTLVVARPL